MCRCATLGHTGCCCELTVTSDTVRHLPPSSSSPRSVSFLPTTPWEAQATLPTTRWRI